MELLKMSPSPHEKDFENTATVMGKVLIALLPATLWACIVFGIRALFLVLISTASCMAAEYIFCLIMKKPSTVCDLSAAVTGVLLAFNIPASAPLWMPVFGGIFAIIVAKCLFGGLGKNIVNPALAARVFLMTSWTSEMSAFPSVENKLPIFAKADIDAISSATPLVGLKHGALPKDLNLFDMLIGNMSGCIGEVSAILLIAGGIYLMCSKVITWHIPVAFIGTVAIITFFLPHGLHSGFGITENLKYMCAELLSGGLVLGAVFMATDYATSPMTGKGKLIYGVGCGLITVFIRYFGGYPEGVSFSILIMNLFVWYIDRLTMPAIFGGGKKK